MRVRVTARQSSDIFLGRSVYWSEKIMQFVNLHNSSTT